MPSNQKKLRDLLRLQQKFGDSIELQRKIKELNHAKEEVQTKEKLKKNATKYHMVKFLERKKLTRMIRSAETKVKNGSDDTDILCAKVEKLKEDLAYVMYFPNEYKYVALFRDDGAASDNRSQIQQTKAREIAVSLWKNDIGTDRDKVAHAMEVEYNPQDHTALSKHKHYKQTGDDKLYDRHSQQIDNKIAKKKRKQNSEANTTEKVPQQKLSATENDSFFVEENVWGDEADNNVQKHPINDSVEMQQIRNAANRKKHENHKRTYNQNKRRKFD